MRLEGAVDTHVHVVDRTRNAIGHFVERLRSDLPFEPAPDDNLRSLALVEAAYRKALRREPSRPASISP